MPIPLPPPSIRWPALIVVLLSISISFSVYTLFAAQSDGGPAIVNDYYQKGKNWNETAETRRRGERLSMDVVVEPAGDEKRLRPVVLTVRSPAGDPVVDLQGAARLYRPQTVEVLATVPLSPVPGQPGTYRQLMPIQSTGLWDVELHATHGGKPLSKTVRVDIR
jgi:hypothetical protein